MDGKRVNNIKILIILPLTAGYAGRKTGSLKKKLKGTWRQPISLNSRKKSLGVGERKERKERERERENEGKIQIYGEKGI